MPRERETRALAKRAFPRRDRLGFGTRSRSRPLGENATHPTRWIRDGSLRRTTSTLLIRLGRARDEAVFSFSRTFDGAAHASGGLVRAIAACGDVAFPARARTSRWRSGRDPPRRSQWEHSTRRVADDQRLPLAAKPSAAPRTTRAAELEEIEGIGAPRRGADEVFALDCGDARIASARGSRIARWTGTSAPDGTDAETLGLDFCVAKVAASAVVRAPPTTKETTKETTRSIVIPMNPMNRSRSEFRFASAFGPTRPRRAGPDSRAPGAGARAGRGGGVGAGDHARAKRVRGRRTAGERSYSSARRATKASAVRLARRSSPGSRRPPPMTGSSRATGSSGSRLRSRNTTGYRTRRRRSRRRGAGSRPSPPKANRTRVPGSSRVRGVQPAAAATEAGVIRVIRATRACHSRRATRPPVPEAAREFLAADVSRDADAVGPRGAHDIAAETEIYAKPKSPNKTQGKKDTRRRFASAISSSGDARRRAAPVRVFAKTSPGSSGWCSRAC